MKLLAAVPVVLISLFVHANDSDIVIIPKKQTREVYENYLDLLLISQKKHYG